MLCSCRAQADFLPVALVLGLSPGVPVEVPIVVIAEDGVTSLRYFLYIVRDQPPANASLPASSASGSGSLIGDGIGGSASGSLANGPSSGGLHFVRSATGTGGAGDEKDGKAADLATTLAASEAPLQPGMLLDRLCETCFKRFKQGPFIHVAQKSGTVSSCGKSNIFTFL